ncbi:esterase-like activity of phytase family protein [Lentibacter algarum]|uniref:esterase-like activity of phytase family protein n=1 Tax=Lentibacter algarum TaxID=576131 RepID=UPI001C06759B|nr:esterase-like activity of phytase family protein [Lentibacter algarum]
MSKIPAIGPEGDTHFGGLSGYEVDSDTRYFLTDRGRLFAASHNGVTSVVLQDKGGKPLAPKLRDSEGLTIVSEGVVAVSFEGEHRIALYESDSGVLLSDLPSPSAFSALQGNSGLEALAGGGGLLLAIPERSGASTAPFPVFVLDHRGWTNVSIPRHGAFLPVGADFGPDGRFYLLERDYLLGGFRSRIRRFDWIDSELTNEETLLKTRFGAHGNLEGIAVFGEGGERVVEMVSDNNFLPVQASEIVRYRIVSP